MLQVNQLQQPTYTQDALPTIGYGEPTPYPPSNYPPPNFPPPPPLSADAFMACNEGIANGFGAMFFNIRDPSFRQTNQPVKQDASLHIALAIMTVILIIGFVVGAVGFNSFLTVGGSIGIFAAGYVLYLIFGLCCSDLREYISNTKRNTEYEATYNRMVKGRGFFKFWIQCYHYVTVRTKNGTSRRKVVTHTATEDFHVAACFDESGQIGNIIDEKNYIFIHYLRRYYFTDDQSQNRFVAAFNSFVHKNTRDCHQNYSHTFDIEGFQEFAGFTALGEANRTKFTFYLFNFLGMGLPYACIFERFVARYEVGLLKRLTV